MFVSRSFRDLTYHQAVSTTGIGECKLIRGTANGHQYAHVKLAVESMESGAGMEFVEQVAEEQAIPERFLSHLEIGCLSVTKHGLWGFPLTDFRIRILDGSYHDGDSSAASFEEAARTATLDAMLHSAPCLLEPWVTVTVRVPEEYLPNVFGDLINRRARLERTVPGTRPSIVCSVPQSEVLDYLSEFASRSGGFGILSLGSPKVFRELPVSEAMYRFCLTCDREMKIPLVRGVAFTENCLICGAAFEPPDSDIGVGVLNR